MYENLCKEFKALLDAEKNEQVYQDFLEQHSELIPTNLCALNHGVHFDFVFSKLKLSQNYTTDFCYLTKSSQEWYIVLIEIEKPSKKIFKKNNNDFEFSSDFNSALNQINNWKIELRDNNSLETDLAPLLGFNPTFLSHPISFKYILIYGRSSELDTKLKKQKFIQARQDHNILIITYDSLLSNLMHPDEEWSYVRNFTPDIRYKNIITKRVNGFKMKYLNSTSKDWFSYLKSEQLDLTEEQKQRLRNEGILIDEWISGRQLCNFGRCLIDDIKGIKS